MSKSIEYTKISHSPEESQESSEEMDVGVSNIPSSQSSAQLIRNNLGNSVSSVENENDNDVENVVDKRPGSRSRLDSSARVGYSSVSSKEWFTVAVLCFINLINYMDRFTIAGKTKTLLHLQLHPSTSLSSLRKLLFKNVEQVSQEKRDFDFDVCVSTFH